MERLTKRDEFGNADIIGVDSADLQLNLDFDSFNIVTTALNRLAAYEDTGLTPEEIEYNKKALELFAARPCGDRVLEITKAEQEGRLLVLPCKVGDRVWGVEFDTSECPHCFGFGGCFGCSGAKPKGVYYFKFRLRDAEKIGKTVFLTRAEAEKAMEVSG